MKIEIREDKNEYILYVLGENKQEIKSIKGIEVISYIKTSDVSDNGNASCRIGIKKQSLLSKIKNVLGVY